MIGFVLCHGWSFDAQTMDTLAENLSRQFPQSPVVKFDLGFTGKPCAPLQDIMSHADTQWIALGHSYGFAYLMQQAVAWRAAISVNGFTRFCRRPGKPEGMPMRLLDAMIARMNVDPQVTVAEFRERCGSPASSPEQLDVSLLGAHLKQLRDLDLPLPDYPVLSLSTRDDLIVPPSLTQACFAHSGCTMQEYEGSHLQLLQDPQPSMAAIAAFVEANRG